MFNDLGTGQAPCVLLVDDEVEILKCLADLLRKEFRVIATDDPDAAIAALTTSSIAVVISDQRMPRMSGARLLERCARLSPRTSRILLTGYSDIDAVIAAVNEGKIYRYVTKPWQSESLLSVVREAASSSQAAQEEITLIQHLAEVARRVASPSGTGESGTKGLAVGATNDLLKHSVASLSEAVAVLEEIKAAVPICVYCHRVQTSRDEWHGIVEYLQNNSVILSHGICPKCFHPVVEKQKTVIRNW